MSTNENDLLARLQRRAEAAPTTPPAPTTGGDLLSRLQKRASQPPEAAPIPRPAEPVPAGAPIPETDRPSPFGAPVRPEAAPSLASTVLGRIRRQPSGTGHVAPPPAPDVSRGAERGWDPVDPALAARHEELRGNPRMTNVDVEDVLREEFGEQGLRDLGLRARPAEPENPVARQAARLNTIFDRSLLGQVPKLYGKALETAADALDLLPEATHPTVIGLPTGADRTATAGALRAAGKGVGEFGEFGEQLNDHVEQTRLADIQGPGDLAQFGADAIAQAVPTSAGILAASLVHPTLGAGAAYGMAVGDVRQEMEQAGVTDPTKLAGMPLLFGVPYAVAERFMEAKVAGRLLGAGVPPVQARGLARRFATEVPKAMVLEGTTEGMQAAITRGAVSIAADLPYLTPDAAMAIAEEAAAGAFGGAPFGTLAAAAPDDARYDALGEGEDGREYMQNRTTGRVVAREGRKGQWKPARFEIADEAETEPSETPAAPAPEAPAPAPDAFDETPRFIAADDPAQESEEEVPFEVEEDEPAAVSAPEAQEPGQPFRTKRINVAPEELTRPQLIGLRDEMREKLAEHRSHLDRIDPAQENAEGHRNLARMAIEAHEADLAAAEALLEARKQRAASAHAPAPAPQPESPPATPAGDPVPPAAPAEKRLARSAKTDAEELTSLRDELARGDEIVNGMPRVTPKRRAKVEARIQELETRQPAADSEPEPARADSPAPAQQPEGETQRWKREEEMRRKAPSDLKRGTDIHEYARGHVDAELGQEEAPNDQLRPEAYRRGYSAGKKDAIQRSPLVVKSMVDGRTLDVVDTSPEADRERAQKLQEAQQQQEYHAEAKQVAKAREPWGDPRAREHFEAGYASARMGKPREYRGGSAGHRAEAWYQGYDAVPSSAEAAPPSAPDAELDAYMAPKSEGGLSQFEIDSITGMVDTPELFERAKQRSVTPEQRAADDALAASVYGKDDQTAAAFRIGFSAGRKGQEPSYTGELASVNAYQAGHKAGSKGREAEPAKVDRDAEAVANMAPGAKKRMEKERADHEAATSEDRVAVTVEAGKEAKSRYPDDPARAKEFVAGAQSARDYPDADLEDADPVFRDGHEWQRRRTPAAKPDGYGAENKVFTKDAAEAARERLRAKLSGRQLNAGIDPELLIDAVTLGGYHVEAGVRTFSAWSAQMVEDVGEGIRPYLRSVYSAIRTWPGFDPAGMDTDAEVERLASRAPEADTKLTDASTRTEDSDGRDQAATDQRGVRGADQPGVPGVSPGRGRDPQPGPAQADPRGVEAGEPDVLRTPASGGADGRARVRGAAEDVGGEPAAPSRGASGDGRARDRGERAPHDGAGDGRSVKDPSSVSPANPGPGNFHIANPLEIVGGSPMARFKKNQAAIEKYLELRDEGRTPTREEQEILAGYTGWGSFGQELFQGSWRYPAPKPGWEARDQWLRDQLGQQEWEGLQRSITNAHYTDPPTVLAMWEMVERMGFKGGRVLEPGMGIGNFFGMMPLHLKNRSQLVGIELDPTTGGMAQMLYPDANIRVMGYQDSTTPDDFYDLVIGNWPFENTVIADRRYNRLRPNLHDYFYLKAIDQVRPGGLVIGITSAGTMDKQSPTIRRALAKKAELVASFRLPSGAFEEYAGTKVVTDIIILRKRPEEVATTADETWINAIEVDTPAGQAVRVNEYYTKNREHVVGTIDYGHGTTTFRPGLIVHRPDDMQGELRRIVAAVPEGAFQQSARPDGIRYITNHTDDREGALTRTDRGFFVVRGEHLAPANEVQRYEVKSKQTTATREAQFSALIEMRGLYGRLIEAERGQGDQDPEPIRTKLRGAYEAFRKKHGALNESYGLSYLEKIDDPFFPALAALETGEPGKWKPATILSRSTIRAPRRLENPTVSDAFVLARNRSVNPSLAEIAEAAGRPADEVKKELLASGAIFETPGGDVEPSDVYLSGNVREKLRQAEAGLAEGNEAMQRNVEALRKVLPADIPYFNIEVQMGATWVPTGIYERFIAHMLNREDTKGIEVAYTLGRWKATLDRSFNRLTEASTGFGTKFYTFSKLVNAALSNQTVTVKRKDPDGSEYVDKEATDEANARIADMREKFGEWLWSDAERRVEMEREYNEVRNAFATPTFDGSFLSFEGMALSLGRGPFDLRTHQANAIWRALVTRKSLNAHEVGTGKTFTMGGIAVESRRYGLARKPVLLAHNANSKSVAAEIQMMYPAAKILYIDNLSPKTVDVKMRQIANDDWDAIVLPHSLIDRLSFKEETLMEMAREEIELLEQEAREAADEAGVKFDDAMLDDPEALKKLRSPTAKELVKARNRIIETIRKQAQQSSREGAVPFEDLGIDMVLVDEAHEFKKPPIATRMRMKGLQTQTSNRSIALSFITRYVRAQNNGGNVHLFTGTPITNTLTEIFHQMRYIMSEEMETYGVDQWDGWFGSFAKEIQDTELTAAGEYEPVTRLRGFINVPELRQMVGQYMDVVFSDDMPEMRPRRTKSGKLLSDPTLTAEEREELIDGRTEGAADRPYKKVVTETADLTPEQGAIFQEVQELAARWRDMSPKERKDAMAEGAPETPILYEQLAARASFDARMARDEELAGQEGKVPDNPNSKISRAIENLLAIYRSDSRTAQVVFTNTGLGTSATRSVRGPAGAVLKDSDGKSIKRTVKVFSPILDMVERLVQQGVPREEIAIVDGSTSKDERKAVADAMNEGRVRIVIGSTGSLGVGVNMQRNLRAMHHLDAPWMPGDLEQRNGRGHRQGNQWNTVLEYRYITDRIDGRRWQVLSIKQKFITDFLRSDGSVRVIEGDAASDADADILETFAEAAGDPRVLVLANLREKLKQLQKRERQHAQAIADARQQIRTQREMQANLRARMERLDEAGVVDAVRTLISETSGEGFRIEVDGKVYEKRADAVEALAGWISANLRSAAEPKQVGQFGGHILLAEWPRFSGEPRLVLDVKGERFVAMRGSLTSLEMTLRNVPENIAKERRKFEGMAGTIQRLEEVAEQPFARADDLERVKKQIAALDADMKRNPAAPPAWLRNGAPMETDVFWNGTGFTVTGHRWAPDGWYVVGEDAKGGEVTIPYLEAKDAQGMTLYEEREFSQPVVQRPKADAPGGAPPAPEAEPDEDGTVRERSAGYGGAAGARAEGEIAFGSHHRADRVADRIAEGAGEAARYAVNGLPSTLARFRQAGRRAVRRAWVSLRGQAARTPRELHRLLHPFRDPRNERFHILLLDEQDRVLSHTMDTSGAVDYVAFYRDDEKAQWFDRLAARAKRTGATRVVVSHNHPSGDPTESAPDRAFTRILDQEITARGLTFAGHYVINHTRGTWIHPDGTPESITIPAGDLPSADWSDFHGQRITGPKSVAQLVKAVSDPQRFDVLYLSTQNEVLALEPHRFESLDSMREWLPAQMKGLGAGAAILVLDNAAKPGIYHATVNTVNQARHLLGNVLDVIDVSREQVRRSASDEGLLDAAPIQPDRIARRVFEEGREYGDVRPAGPVQPAGRAPERTRPGGRPRPADRAAEPIELLPSAFDDVEARWKEAKGIQSPTLLGKAREGGRELARAFTRHFPLLDTNSSATIALTVDTLRQYEGSPGWAKAVAYDRIREVVDGLTDAQVDLLTRVLVLRDLQRSAEEGRYGGEQDESGVFTPPADAELPYGYTPATLATDLQRFEAALERDRKVSAALEKRQSFARQLTERLVKMELLRPEVLEDDRYYHRQVMKHMDGEAYVGTGSRDVRLKPKGFQRGRVQSAADANTRYQEAEFEWVSQALSLIARKETLERVQRINDIRPQLKRQAKALNAEAVIERVAETDGDGAVLEDPFLPWRRKIAISNGQLAKLAQAGALSSVGGRFDDVIERLAESYTLWKEGNRAVEKEDRVPFTFDHPQWFPFLSHLAENDLEGGLQARTVFKAIREREEFVKQVLGNDYLTWEKLLPEGYSVWQPEKGNHFFMAATVEETVLDAVLSGEKALQDEDVRRMMVVGGRKEEWVIPSELAATLDKFQPEFKEDALEAVWTGAQSSWKQWILLNPVRVLKYNLNNMSGDLDIALAYDPKILGYYRQAAADLWRYQVRGQGSKELKAEIQDAIRRGVVDSGLSIAEIPDINKTGAFRALTETKAGPLSRLVKTYWENSAMGGVRGFTNWRENILRLAAYRYFQEQTKGSRSVYGASKRHEVDAIRDPKDRSAKLARELIGDYGNVSQAGQWIRRHMIPFYSWLEINAPRYYRLLQNLPHEDVHRGGRLARTAAAAGVRGAGAGASLLLKMHTLYLAAALWNRFLFGEEEDELRRQGREAHLILGRHANGDIRTLRIEGAFADALDWFGASDYTHDLVDLVEGEADVLDKMAEAIKAPINRVVMGWEPFSKTGFELAFGRTAYPSIFEDGKRFGFRSRPIRDRWERALGMLSMDKLYNTVMAKKPRRPSGPLGPLETMVFYRTDPGEAAYWETRRKLVKFLREEGKDAPDIRPTERGNALYYYRRAIQWGDLSRAEHWRKRYVELGGTTQGMRASIERGEPLGSLSRRERRRFLETLTAQDRREIDLADAWYQQAVVQRARGRTAGDPRVVQRRAVEGRAVQRRVVARD